MKVEVDIIDEVRPALEKLKGTVRADRVSMVAARGAAIMLRAFFQTLENTRPNKQGFPRQHFWAQVRRGVQTPKLMGQSAVVSINHVGLGQRYYGGEIKPKNGSKFLTIPWRSEAYGKRAREFTDLVFAIVEGIGPALVKKVEYKEKFNKKWKGDGQLKMAKGGTGKAFRETAKEGMITVEKTGGEVFYLLRRSVNQRPDPSVMPTKEEFGQVILKSVSDMLNRLLARQKGASQASTSPV